MKKLVVLAGLAGWLISGDWLIGLCSFVLALGWIVLQADEGPPVLALAFTLQWITVCIGLYYVNLTGRPLQATLSSDYQPMVLIGLGCLIALMAGLWVGQWLISLTKPLEGVRPAYALTFKSLVICYVAGTAVAGGIHQFAWSFPSITQAIIAISFIRLGLLYLVLRRLVANDQWAVMAGVLTVEIGLGVTGFHAGFREPLIMAVLAFLERFDRRNVRHWASLGVLFVAMGMLGVAWMSVRVDYRERYLADEAFSQNRGARLDSLTAATRHWATQDKGELYANIDIFIDRLWAIYYPALAVSRVPDVIPHTGGKLMLDTLQFVFEPRIFFPDKPDVGSDSELVRKYSGVYVAGEESSTDIAFGYAAESYIDFGVPLMFIPMFIWGAFMGIVYGGIFKYYRHRDIAVSIATVICWLTLYLFERSWAKTIGLGGTLIIYVGALSFLLDRLWFEKFRTVYVDQLSDADESIGTAPPPLQFQPHTK
jgi:hypothetical protein